MSHTDESAVSMETGFVLGPGDSINPAWRLTARDGRWLIVDDLLSVWARGDAEYAGTVRFFTTRKAATHAALAGQRERRERIDQRIRELQTDLLTESAGGAQ